ncbi:hypothetical protein ABZ646_44695 [Streptomyces sp. NPDC007162]|uniref:hypothetical protein n=1 Tax=Streptomyces sp. NPDC007162 TaxID=3156917 RepID=UPI00340F593C
MNTALSESVSEAALNFDVHVQVQGVLARRSAAGAEQRDQLMPGHEGAVPLDQRLQQVHLGR